MRTRRTLRQLFWPLAGGFLFLAALALIRRELGQYSIESVRDALFAIPPGALLLAVGLTALDYVVLVGYDTLGVRYAGKKLEAHRIALASTTGYAFSQALGFPLLTGAPIRYRLYTSWGLDRLDVAKIVAFCTVTFWLGFLALGGAVLLITPVELPEHLGLLSAYSRALGAALVTGAVGYVLWCGRVRRPIRFGKAVFGVPTARVAILQIGVASADWLLSGAVLWALLPQDLGLGFWETLSLFVVAHVLGLVSHVPGGVGVFEAAILLYLPASEFEPAVLGSLLAYRFIFYLLPLLVGAVTLTVSEVRANRAAAEDLASAAVTTVSSVAPRAVAALTFLTGTILVLSGAVPITADTRLWLTRFVPLPLFELSHFGGSLAGAALLILARGLQRRLDGAYHITLWLVMLGTLLTAIGGFGLAQLVPLLILVGVLLVSRREFHRKASLLAETFTTEWVVAIALVVVTTIWLGAFSYSRLEYSTELWWSFALNGNAPRFLRGAVGAATLVGLFAVARLLRPAPAADTNPDATTLERVEGIVAAAPSANAHLALLGDKQILLSESGRSFIMYAVEGNSWVAMGDPVGEPGEFRDLAWRFREQADRAGDSVAFYQVKPENLPIYVDLGLSLLKLGEEASVKLSDFTLEGPRRADFRKAIRRLDEVGASFEVVPREGVPALLGDLEAISDAWLRERNVGEKGFSLGTFDREYLSRLPMALVRVSGRPVAFGNLWLAGKQELSLDLIRYGSDAPKSTMDYLFARLIQWGQSEGFERMALGMAPLSGLSSESHAPLWSRLGAAVFRYGGHFYSFQGLRAYKEKFDPEWQPRYLASPPGLRLPRTLTDVATLISAGIPGAADRDR